MPRVSPRRNDKCHRREVFTGDEIIWTTGQTDGQRELLYHYRASAVLYAIKLTRFCLCIHLCTWIQVRTCQRAWWWRVHRDWWRHVSAALSWWRHVSRWRQAVRGDVADGVGVSEHDVITRRRADVCRWLSPVPLPRATGRLRRRLQVRCPYLSNVNQKFMSKIIALSIFLILLLQF